MGRKKEEKQPNIKRYTIQMDEELYQKVRLSAMQLKVKTYELVNRLVLIGARAWIKLTTDPKVKAQIDISGQEIDTARELEARVVAREKATQK